MINGFSDTSDSIFRAAAMGKKADIQIKLVGISDSDNEIRIFNACFFKDIAACAVALNAHNIKMFCKAIYAARIYIYYRYTMAFSVELFGYCSANLSAAYNNNFHYMISVLKKG